MAYTADFKENVGFVLCELGVSYDINNVISVPLNVKSLKFFGERVGGLFLNKFKFREEFLDGIKIAFEIGVRLW